MDIYKKIKEMDRIYKVLLLFIVIFSISIVLSWKGSVSPDEGNHSILGLFYLKALKWWIGNPTFDLGSIFSFGVNYLNYYPTLSVYYPPLLHFLLAESFFLLGPSILAGRLVVLVCSVLTLFILFKLGKDLFDKKIALLAVVFLGTSFVFFQLSRKVMQEIPMMLFFLISIYFYNKTREDDGWRNYILGGLFFGLSFLTKWLALPLVVILFFFADTQRENLPKVFSSIVLVGVIVAPWAFIAYKLKALFIPLVTSVTNLWVAKVEPASLSIPGLLYYPIKFFTQQTSLLLGGFAISSLVYYIWKGGRNRPGIVAWVLSVLIFALLISNKGWRFTLLYIPALCLLSGWGIEKLRKKVSKKQIYVLLSILLISQVVFLGTSLNFRKDTDERNVVKYLSKREGPILFSYNGNGLFHTSFMFLMAKEGKRKVYRGSIFRERGEKYFERITKRGNIHYAILPEDLEGKKLNYILSPDVKGFGYQKDLHVKKLIQNSSLWVKEEKVDSVWIYRNKKYNPDKGITKCNYVGAIEQWVCTNTTLQAFNALS